MVKPVSARQISDAIDEGFELVCKNVKKLLKHGEIKQIELDRYYSRAYLNSRKVTHRMNFYFPINLDFDPDQLVDPDSL